MSEQVVESKSWILTCKCQHSNKEIIIVAVYRSPSSSEREFCQLFSETLDTLNDINKNVIIAGDFNIDWKKKWIL